MLENHLDITHSRIINKCLSSILYVFIYNILVRTATHEMLLSSVQGYQALEDGTTCQALGFIE
jgi:hypothetical protein